jgi:hypothetical protein
MTEYTAENPLRVLSLGWGVQSWTLAAMSALGELPRLDYAVHADTTHEMAGTYDHAKKWTPWLEEHGIKVITVSPSGARANAVSVKSSGPVSMIPAFIEGNKGQARRKCTREWKITPIRQFVRSVIGNPQPGIVESWQGISLDEWSRMRTSDVAYITHVFPLVDRRISRANCVGWLESHDLDVPTKSACTFCPYHSGPFWKALKKNGGTDWDEAIQVDGNIRNAWSEHELFLHRSGLPLGEAISIPEDVGAEQLELPCDSGHCFT